jgi:hypothetical protein
MSDLPQNLPEPLPEREVRPTEPVPAREMRASDADREKVAAVLREAAGEGRLGLDELDERLAAVYAARTYAELEPLTRDLPTAHTTYEPVLPPVRELGDLARFGGEPTSSGGFALLGGFERKGTWVAPENFTAFAMLGGGDVDLRRARFASRKMVIRAWAILGGVQVTVPEDAEVHVGGVGILGGFDNSASGAGQPGGPVVVVKGFALLGGVSVERKASDDEIKRRKLERKEERRRAKLERKQLRAQ